MMQDPDALRLRREGRTAGALYLVVVLSGMFCLAYVPPQLGATLAEARAHSGLFRAGIAAFLLMQVAFLLVPLALYRVFADVDRRAAVLMVALAAVSVPIGLVAVTHRLEALSLLQDPAHAGEAAQAAFSASLRRYGQGLRIASLFWGLWLLPFGWLVLRSARLPRVLGLLLVLGGIGYVAKALGGLAPDIAASGLLDQATLPAALGEIGSCLWLLAFGARQGRTGASPVSPS
ncbi:MAG: DUF4386 domain-containing protein [Thermomonas haemolytica]